MIHLVLQPLLLLVPARGVKQSSSVVVRVCGSYKETQESRLSVS